MCRPSSFLCCYINVVRRCMKPLESDTLLVFKGKTNCVRPWPYAYVIWIDQWDSIRSFRIILIVRVDVWLFCSIYKYKSFWRILRPSWFAPWLVSFGESAKLHSTEIVHRFNSIFSMEQSISTCCSYRSAIVVYLVPALWLQITYGVVRLLDQSPLEHICLMKFLRHSVPSRVCGIGLLTAIFQGPKRIQTSMDTDLEWPESTAIRWTMAMGQWWDWYERPCDSVAEGPFRLNHLVERYKLKEKRG